MFGLGGKSPQRALGPDPSAHPWSFIAKESLDRAIEPHSEIGNRHPRVPISGVSPDFFGFAVV